MDSEVKMSRNVSIQQIRQNSPANQSSQEVKNTETQEIDVSVREISSDMWGSFNSHINNSHKDKKIPPPPPPKSSMPPESSSAIQAGDKTEVKSSDKEKLQKEIDELTEKRQKFIQDTYNNYNQNQIKINKINNDIRKITTFLKNNINAKGKEIEDKKKELEVLENQKKEIRRSQ